MRYFWAEPDSRPYLVKVTNDKTLKSQIQCEVQSEVEVNLTEIDEEEFNEKYPRIKVVEL